MISDIDYLSATLIGEARGETIESIIGVGNAIRNRVRASHKTYKDICLAPKQFSCWNSNDPNFHLLQQFLNDIDNGNNIIDPYIRQCMFIAKGIYYEDLRDNTKGAKNYVSAARYHLAVARRDSVEDGWIVNMEPSVKLGNHVFLV